MKLIRTFASAFFCIALLISCRLARQDVPPKPPGVPAQAFWVGGADGGVYVDLSKIASDPSDCYRGSIFEDRSGTLWFKGKFKLIPTGSSTIDVRDAGLFSGWDGDSLLLKDGRKLVAQK